MCIGLVLSLLSTQFRVQYPSWIIQPSLTCQCSAAVSCACAGFVLLAVGGIAATIELQKYELRSAQAGTEQSILESTSQNKALMLLYVH